ncbi:MAG: tRNA adenosine(34) deaminase TadA [Woeseiaceae bacterium]
MSNTEFMQAALEQAQLAAAAGEAPVGAVLVSQGAVIAKAHNRTLVDHDPSGHAEIIALRAAARQIENHRLGAMTLYVTLEPCAMCVGAIVQARIARVVFGAYDQKAGALGSAIDLSDSAAFNHRFEIQGGLMAEDCADILQRFFAARR